MSSDTDSDGHPMDAAVCARVATAKQHKRPRLPSPASSLESGEVPPSREPTPIVHAPSLSEPTPTRKKRIKKKKKHTAAVSQSPSITGRPTATPTPTSSDCHQQPALPVGVQLYDANGAAPSTNEAMRRLLRQPRWVGKALALWTSHFGAVCL